MSLRAPPLPLRPPWLPRCHFLSGSPERTRREAPVTAAAGSLSLGATPWTQRAGKAPIAFSETCSASSLPPRCQPYPGSLSIPRPESALMSAGSRGPGRASLGSDCVRVGVIRGFPMVRPHQKLLHLRTRLALLWSLSETTEIVFVAALHPPSSHQPAQSSGLETSTLSAVCRCLCGSSGLAGGWCGLPWLG